MALADPVRLQAGAHEPFSQHWVKEKESYDHYFANKDLPPGFPGRVTSKSAWTGSDFSDTSKFTYHLTDDDRAEIDNALESFNAHGLDGDLVEASNFPLPTLQHTLRAQCPEIYSGRGFFLPRGLDYSKYSVEDNTIIFLGIQSYIAEKRARQDEKGNMIVHIVTDDTMPAQPLKGFHTRHTKSAIPFHTDDLGDILAFQTRSVPLKGGNCILAPSNTIYNELAATRPDVIRALTEPNWPLHLPYYHKRPLLFYEDSRIFFNFSPNAILGSKAHPRPPNIPSVTPRQLEALDLIQELAEKHCISFKTRVGDCHFFNNMGLLHRRDASDIRPGEKRHLIRMYLRNEAARWKIPEVLSVTNRWNSSYQQTDEEEEVWHIEPMPDVFFPLIRKPN